jgi:HlyD family secretion protein
MDRPLDPQFTRARARRRLAWGVALGLAGLAGAFVLPGAISPSVSRARIRTAVVERGPVEATISATGLVLPEVEQVVTTPVDARVVRILHRAGATVHPGESLVDLDVGEARLAVERLSQDLALKANEQARRRIALEGSLIDLDARLEVKRLQLGQFQAELERDRQLQAEGLLSVEQFRKSELAATQAVVELKQIQAERENAQRSTRAEIDGLALEMTKLRGEEAQARRLLELAGIRADRRGVVTWSLTQEGVAIRAGDPVARLADLGAFRVEASVSDVHGPRLAPGLPAVVKVGESRLDGLVTSVNPAVTNGVITLGVALREPAHGLLRPNLRVDVELVTERRPDALRIRRGPFATGEGTQPVFVVRGDRAVRAEVTFGVSSADYFEVRGGLVEGDEAIVSDMRDHASRGEVRLR